MYDVLFVLVKDNMEGSTVSCCSKPQPSSVTFSTIHVITIKSAVDIGDVNLVSWSSTLTFSRTFNLVTAAAALTYTDLSS